MAATIQQVVVASHPLLSRRILAATSGGPPQVHDCRVRIGQDSSAGTQEPDREVVLFVAGRPNYSFIKAADVDRRLAPHAEVASLQARPGLWTIAGQSWHTSVPSKLERQQSHFRCGLDDVAAHGGYLRVSVVSQVRRNQSRAQNDVIVKKQDDICSCRGEGDVAGPSETRLPKSNPTPIAQPAQTAQSALGGRLVNARLINHEKLHISAGLPLDLPQGQD